MKKKKILAVIASLTLALTAFTACGSDDSSSSKNDDSSSVESSASAGTLKIDGKVVDTKDKVFLKVGDYEVGFDQLRYCYYSFLNNYGSSMGFSDATFSSLSDEELKTQFDSFKEYLQTYIKGNFVYKTYATEHKITLDDADKKTAKENLEKIKEEQSSSYSSYLSANNVTEDYLLQILEDNQLADKVTKSIDLTEAKFLKKAATETSQVIQIYIPYGSEEKISDEVLSSNSITDYSKLSNSEKTNAILSNYSSLSEAKQTAAKKASKKVADEIYQKLSSGTDFVTLMKKYGYDPDMVTYSGGKLVGENYSGYSDEYIKVVKGLKVGEYTKVTPIEAGNLGYYIIKRVDFDNTYIKKNIDTFLQEYNYYYEQKILNPIYDKIEITPTDLYKNLSYGDIS